MKKILAILLATLMVAALGMTAFAAESDYKITVTNTNDSISIDGQTYSAYKLFDLSYNTDKTAYSYTISTSNYFYTTAGAKTVLDNYFTFTASAGDSTVMVVEPKTDGAYYDSTSKTITEAGARALADALQPYLASATPVKTGTASGETAEITVGEDGYFIVTGSATPTDPKATETVVSAVILTNAQPTATVKPKASVPTLDKKITGVTDDGDVLDEKGKAAVAKVGATVSYELDSTVPDLNGYTKYTFTFGDKITNGLDYVSGSFKLKIGNGEETTVSPTIAEGGKSFTYTITYDTFKTYLATAGNKPGDKITLTYKCTVNDAALTTDYENNTADLTYSHSPYDDTTNKTPEKETYVIDLNLDVDKIDGSDSTKHLDGAQFKLYREVTTTTPAAEEGGEATTSTTKEYYKWDATNKKVTWVAEADADVFETNDQGKLKQQVRGLDNGNYFLVETKAPKGYNMLKDPIAIVITATPDSEENVTKVTYSATYGGEDAKMTNDEVDLTTQTQAAGKQPVATGTIENNSGAELPSTGGIGTTIFYVLGGLLAVGAGVVLVTKKRMGKEEN